MKFVIVCSSRTGSTMLNSAFDNHPKISGFDEAMTARNVKPHNLIHNDPYIKKQRTYRYTHSLWFWFRHIYTKNVHTPFDITYKITKKVLSDWLDWLYSLDENVCFKLLHPHIITHPIITELVYEKNIKPILLIRDPEERIASMRAKWKYDTPQIEMLEQTLEELGDLRGWFPDHLEVSYEEITNNKEVRELPKEVTKKIFDYLELPFDSLTAVSNKVRK